MGFKTSKADASLFIYKKENRVTYILLYVDDIVLIVSTTSLLQYIIAQLKGEFPMIDMGILNHFLGIKANFNAKGLF